LKKPGPITYLHGNSGTKVVVRDSTEIAHAWLKLYVDSLGECAPDSDTTYLPPITKLEVYHQYLNQHEINFISKTQFYRLWKTSFPTVKMPHIQQLGRCSICCNFLEILRETKDADKRSKTRQTWRAHIDICKQERLVYNLLRQRSSEIDQKEFISIAEDAMDQSKTCPPIFPLKSKDESSYTKLKTRVMGVIVHGAVTKKLGFFLTGEFLADSNVTIECLNRTLQLVGLSNLPPVLHLQLDNTKKDNKNKKVFSFLAALVKKHIFQKVIVSFLPIGHTHNDVDAMFGVFSKALQKSTCKTLLNIFENCEKPNLVSCLIDHVTDYWSWLEPAAHPIGYTLDKAQSFLFTMTPFGTVQLRYKDLCFHENWLPPEGLDFLPGNFNNLPIGIVPSLLLPISELKATIERIRDKLGESATWWDNYLISKESEYKAKCTICTEAKIKYKTSSQRKKDTSEQRKTKRIDRDSSVAMIREHYNPGICQNFKESTDIILKFNSQGNINQIEDITDHEIKSYLVPYVQEVTATVHLRGTTNE